MENESAFTILNPTKIFSKLTILLKNKRLITVYFGTNNETFVTTLIDVDKKANVFICDGCNEASIERLLNSQKIIFETEHLGAKVVFNATKVKRLQYQGQLAFSVVIPETMRWVEHREFYRLKTPTYMPGFCELTLIEQEKETLNLYDISIRGFSVLIKPGDISALLVPKTLLDNAKLILSGIGEYPISFEVRNKFLINPDKLNEMEKIGCKFTHITPAFEDTVQRYMLQVEREILKKKEQGMAVY